MKYAVQINVSPYGHYAGLDAFYFIKAALNAQHQIVRVFFYQEGVYHAFGTVSPPDDEICISQLWSDLAAEHDIDLVVCISAAQRRGLLTHDEAQQQGKQDDNVAKGFRIAGLGLWVEATLLADRCLVFA